MNNVDKIVSNFSNLPVFYLKKPDVSLQRKSQKMLAKALTVSQFIEVLNRSLEQFYSIVVEGEISQSNRYASGHWYFSIKDEKAVLKCVMWRSNLYGLKEAFRVGDKVRLTGKPNVYEGNGGLSFICSKIERAGEGKLYELFLQLKNELAALGWFDQSRKKPIPKVPHVVAIVTSQGGAALRDVLHRLSDRAPYVFPILYHTPVQGEGSAEQIAEALRRANREAKAEVILLVRGGGSIEDLWSFNEKIVAQAIYESSIPVITGVGHETDFTIADMVADFRAPTPTGAAEAAAERKEVLEEKVASQWQRLARGFEALMDRNLQNLAYFSSPFESPERLLQPLRLKLVTADRLRAPALAVLQGRVNASFGRIEAEAAKVRASARADIKYAARSILSPERFLNPFKTRVSAAFLKVSPDFSALQMKLDSVCLSFRSSEGMMLRACRGDVGRCSAFLNAAVMNRLQHANLRLLSFTPRLTYPIVAQARRCAELGQNLNRAIDGLLLTEKKQLKRQTHWLKLGRPKLTDAPINAAAAAMRTAISQSMQMKTLRLQTLEQVWLFLDPKRTALPGTGYVFLNGKPVSSVREVKSGDFVEILLKDGSFDARVGTVKQES